MHSKRETGRSILEWVAGVLLLAGALWMLPHGRLHDLGAVPWFLAGAGLMVAGFFLALQVREWNWGVVAGVAVLTRVMLLFQVPGADIYRYIWEGRILGAGWNPYLLAPNSGLLQPLRDGLWELVQHKTFTAIYPPLAEWIFAGMAVLSATPLFFKLVFLFADLAVAWVVACRFGIAPCILYAWNPLVIYSYSGGGHYDSLFVLAIVLAWAAWSDRNKTRSVFCLGVAVAIKWLALPLLAWAGWRIFLEAWKSKRWPAFCIASSSAVFPLAASYVALGVWTGEWTLQLHPPKFSQYARSAEFIPGIVGWFWEQSKYHNQWFAVPVVAGWMWIILRGRDFARSAEWLFFLALVLTPMMHAWYFTWMIPFAVATRNRGTIAVTASAFFYFLLYHYVEVPGAEWVLHPWETALLWLPFVAGFLWSAWKETQQPQLRKA